MHQRCKRKINESKQKSDNSDQGVFNISTDVSMDYGVVSGVGKEAAAIQGEFADLFSKVGSLVRDLDGIWQGSAKEEFITAYNKLKPRFETVSGNLSDYSSAMSLVVSREQQTEGQISTTFKSI